jgi:hypothetical protein
MKKYILITVLLMASTAFATVVVTFNVSDSYAQKMLTAFAAQDDSNIQIEIIGSQGASGGQDYRANLSFRTPARDPNDSDLVYGKKRIGLLIDAFVKAHERKLKVDAWKAYNAAAPSVKVGQPDPNEVER